MNVLIVKNVLSEGPGTIEDFLRQQAIPYRILEMHAGDAVPSHDSFSHLVVLGGPMAVYEMSQYPYLVRETALIEEAIRAEKPVLGVCLGAQMLAHVLGARVYAGGKKEIGWYEVSITDEGMKDPFFSGLSVDGKAKAQVFQWHGDTFDLPWGAARLASSDLYPNQAFRYGSAVYALQFHIEVTPKIVREWLAHEKGIDVVAVNAESERIFTPYLNRANNAYRQFFRP
jgi:GMP synthase-like glutamine amidotransferase